MARITIDYKDGRRAVYTGALTEEIVRRDTNITMSLNGPPFVHEPENGELLLRMVFVSEETRAGTG